MNNNTHKDHPFFFTWTAQNKARPLEITKARGAHFTTSDDIEWLDFGSLCYHANAGHGHTRIVDAICAQARSLCVASPSAIFPAKEKLARKLLDLAPPGFTKVFFTLGGAEATENALKIARLVTGRHKLISRYRSYHGATMGALTLSGDYRRPPLEPGLPGVVHAMDCYCDRCPFGQKPSSCRTECARHIGDLLDLEGPRSVAAVFLEPVPGANGVLIPPKEYWPLVREACDRHGTLLVADEVLTGFGRTGSWFAFEHFGAVPDMITVGKALTGGYAPMGAVLVHERIAERFDEETLYAGLTNYAHPLGCAAALEAIRVYEEEGLIERARSFGPTIQKALDDLQAKHPERILHTRSIGMLGALEIDADDEAWDRLVHAVRDQALYIFLKGHIRMIVLAPPLCIFDEDLQDGFQRLDACLHAMNPTP